MILKASIYRGLFTEYQIEIDIGFLNKYFPIIKLCEYQKPLFYVFRNLISKKHKCHFLISKMAY